MYKGEYRYAATRLDGTYILYRGKPVYVQHVNGDGVVFAEPIGGGEEIHDHLDNFLFKGIRLGYINTNRNAEYLARMPRRRDWRQGLRNNNTAVIVDDNVMPISGEHFRSLFRKYKEEFPSVKQAVSRASKAGNLKAFSFDWATDGKSLFYRGNSGCGVVEKGQFVLDPRFKHLKESLERSAGDEGYRIVYGA